ncbi:HNH endonuclease [Williamsia phyllosphaerae]|uniref:HNH endonuclease 5 domain-containing protein n=1 Tax=Williamsia phyllosphaerae TaxID=885042 RepID=A0ABQ1V6R1_9NOCA|nr:HNH endonuclease [Williamsia phyllosphaerae]GGF39317.1 hypothetical protein GCM10007298_38760 [Williamsia phyllosphaerae]
MTKPTTKRKRRPKGLGSVHMRSRDNLWIGSFEVPSKTGAKRGRKSVTSMQYCQLQLKMRDLRNELGIGMAPIAHARPLTAIEVSNDKGTHTRKEWVDLLRSVQGICHYCGELALPPTKDHMIPVALGGTSAIENIAVSCEPCNWSKGALTAEQFMARRVA